MTSGKLLHMKTSSPYAQNPVAVEASEMTNGVIMKIEGDSLTSGSGLTLTTNQGSSMISSMSSQNIESIVSNDGRFLVNANVASSLHLHDQITLEKCDHGKNTHIDTFMITQITKNVTSKYTCAVDCKTTTSSSTTTNAPQTSTTTANASTTTNAPTGVTSTGSPSNATTTSAASVATTTTAPSAYICSSIDDRDASNRSTVSFVNAKDCTRTSRTICEYNTHGYIDVSFTDGTQTLNVFTITTNHSAGMETCMLRRDGGKLLYVDGSEQTGGTLLAMSAEHLTEGTGMHITGDDLVTGSLIKLSSKSTNVTNGILRMDTNDVRSGKLVSIEANKLEDGSAIDISNDGSSLSTGSLIKLSSKSTNVTNGILRMDTNDVRSGKLVFY